jgi:hypothetical protein
MFRTGQLVELLEHAYDRPTWHGPNLGVANHDVYHAGQIGLLKRLYLEARPA